MTFWEIIAAAENDELKNLMTADSKDIKKICVFMTDKLKFTLILLFASDERSLNGNFSVNYMLAQRELGKVVFIKTLIDESERAFQSISKELPGASAYEREIYDMYGLKPKGHPDLRRLVFHSNWPENTYPLEKNFEKNLKPETADVKVSFKEVQGSGVYEIPVGPVHAGIIEPGHFRFSVAGEPVINLEAQLYFVHKGIEKLSEGSSIEKCLYISERISGDETFSNSLAYSMAIENIAGIIVPDRAQYTRVVFAEIERLTSHLGDLAGICLDVAYGFAAFQFRMLRGWTYQIADELCGMRFLRSVNKIGGVRKDFIAGKEKSITDKLLKILKELKETEIILKGNSVFMDRVENTGILEHRIAADLNATGPGGRASGIRYDVRKAFPYAAYGKLEFIVPEHNNGDVNCRMNTKIEECMESIGLILKAIGTMSSGKIIEPMDSLKPYESGYAMTESPRGENIHWVMTGENNTIFRYKIRTPSFCLWPALCHAVRGNIVPDFPLINKSFNLSYAGNDL